MCIVLENKGQFIEGKSAVRLEGCTSCTSVLQALTALLTSTRFGGCLFLPSGGKKGLDMNGLSVINSQQENGLSEINRKETGDGRKKNGHGADAVCRAYMEA
jgi:hypothetical protein